jgi:thiamine-phosphate pyrophosphorylase
MICLVTDRRRRDILEQVAEAAAAGIDLVQIRERDWETAPLAGVVTDAVRLTRGTGTRIVVNDRIDVALTCGADGVHLRADSVRAADARRLAPPGFLIGRSVHSAGEAAAAGEVDYLIAGTLFATASKRHAEHLLGLDGLGAIVAATGSPVLAIGGVTIDRVEEIAATGAAGVAAMALFGVPGKAAAIAEAIRRRFDSVKTPS